MWSKRTILQLVRADFPETKVPVCRSVRRAGREGDRCISHFHMDSTLIGALYPAYCELKNIQLK